MKSLFSTLTLAASLVFTPGPPAAGSPASPAIAPSQAAADPLPPVLLLNASALVQVQAAARTGDPSLQPALASLRTRADAALARAPLTVTAKNLTPPSGDVHDYVSLSIYWWPDPTSPSGTPYIQRDGVRNPEADDTARYDANPLTRTVADIEQLSLAYYLAGDERYARHAAQLLRSWFLDPATRMNPNFRYAQLIPGRDAVRGIGIIESRRFTQVVDSVALLGGCPCWSLADQDSLRTWFREFETWLRTSPNGQMESRTTNNHAVWYDVQLADFALFAGDVEVARQVIRAAPSSRIDTQIGFDGAMPRELERTRSLHYSNFNLQAFAELATLGQLVDVDLWSYATSPTSPTPPANDPPLPRLQSLTSTSPAADDPSLSSAGSSIRQAIDFLVPYLTTDRPWPYDEITDVDPYHEAAQTLARAAQAYPDGPYAQLLARLADGHSADDDLRLTLGYWPD